MNAIARQRPTKALFSRLMAGQPSKAEGSSNLQSLEPAPKALRLGLALLHSSSARGWHQFEGEKRELFVASLSSRKWMMQGLLRTEETWPLVRRTRGLTFINMVNGERARSLDSIRSSCNEERPSRMLLLPDSIHVRLIIRDILLSIWVRQ